MQECAIAKLRCPVCAGTLVRQGGSLCCPAGHCFDVARQGYVNLAPGRKSVVYNRQLFESRAQVFRAGIFAPVLDALTQAINRYVTDPCPVVLDAGCGEGYYLRAVAPERDMVRIGFDLSKEAVRLACGAAKNATFFVGDLAAIPMQDGCCDAVLDVFTPAHYGEFRRVLKPGGVLLKLAPRAGYLRELRQAASAHLRHAEYDGSQVEHYARAHMHMLEERVITYTIPVEGKIVSHLALMTPMLSGVDVAQLNLSGVRSITVDEVLYIGTL